MPPKLSIPGTLVWLRDWFIEFNGEEYPLHIDTETWTPYIQLKEDGQTVDFPLIHGDEITLVSREYGYERPRVLSEHDHRAPKRVYKPWTNWRD